MPPQKQNSRSSMFSADDLDAAEGVFLVSDAEGRALYANRAVERRTGFGLGEVIGKTPGALWGGQMPRDFYLHLWQTIEDRHEPFTGEVINRRKDKTRYLELLAIAPVLGAGGTPEYFIAFQMKQLSLPDQRRFVREFRDMFSPVSRYSDREKWCWILKALGISKMVTRSEPVTFSRVLSDALVGSTARKFRTRTDDQPLILAAQTELREFRSLYEKYRRGVYLYLVHHLAGDREVAEDLTQDTFYRAIRYIGSFRLSNASYGTYLTRVAHNLLLNHLRKKRETRLSDVSAGEVPDRPAALSDDAVFDHPKLSFAERRALRLKYQSGYAAKDIAQQMNKSENAIKLLLSRGRKKLKKKIMAQK